MRIQEQSDWNNVILEKKKKKKKDKLPKFTWINQYMPYKYMQKETQIQVHTTGGDLTF